MIDFSEIFLIINNKLLGFVFNYNFTKTNRLFFRFNIENGDVTYQCRFLSSEAYKRNKSANRIVVSEFGTCAVPDPCQTIFQKYVKNLLGHNCCNFIILTLSFFCSVVMDLCNFLFLTNACCPNYFLSTDFNFLLNFPFNWFLLNFLAKISWKRRIWTANIS